MFSIGRNSVNVRAYVVIIVVIFVFTSCFYVINQKNIRLFKNDINNIVKNKMHFKDAIRLLNGINVENSGYIKEKSCILCIKRISGLNIFINESCQAQIKFDNSGNAEKVVFKKYYTGT
jgi:hypothetical protein